MDLEEINKRLKVETELKNNQPVDEFEGRTPKEMYYILYNTFHPDSPFQFSSRIDNKVLKEIPILTMTSFFLKTVQESQPIKLTPKGNLPLKLVKSIYELGFFPSYFIDSGFSKIRSEKDDVYTHTMRLLCELAGLIKKQKGKLSLTAKGKKLIKEENLFVLFQEIFIAYTTKFNWPYNDRYGDHPIGQLGFAFSLELISKYGNELLPGKFYAQKYIKAFPMVLDHIEKPIYHTIEEEAVNCYVLRTFYFFLKMFGMVELTEKGKDRISAKLFIKKSPVLDQVIRFEE
jgi:predicted transcriptional regulator